MEKLFLKLGIPTYQMTVQTDIPGTATLQIPIGKILNTNIGRIYGMSIYTDGKTIDNKLLPTFAQSNLLYLQLVYGATQFITGIRLSDMVYRNAAATAPAQRPYFPVNIPYNFSLDQSFFVNPTSIVTVTTIAWNLFYISMAGYKKLEEKGFVLINGEISESAKQAGNKFSGCN
jgi:hypothetical protein